MTDFNTGGTEQFEFRGKAGEWFGIWIVNLLLSIITIGIYSAWAKVRRKKYFYNNTYVAGRNFDYHATGKQILIGRLIFVGGYGVFYAASLLHPGLAVLLSLVVLCILPWLIVKSMQFNARVSSFSNVRFNFVGKKGRAFVVFVLLPVGIYLVLIGFAVAATLIAQNSGSFVVPGLLGLIAAAVMFVALPIVDRAIKFFVINHALLGKAEFSLDIALRPFLIAMAAALGWVLLVLVVGFILFWTTLTGLFAAFENAGAANSGVFGIVLVFYIAFFIAFLPASFIYQAMVRNAVYNAAKLEGGHMFRSTIAPLTLFWIALSNAIVVLCSVGLMLPWAHVRMHRYMAQQTFLLPGDSLDHFLSDQIDEGMSVADAYTDLEGVDFGLPL